jgi:hypothetical protein
VFRGLPLRARLPQPGQQPGRADRVVEGDMGGGAPGGRLDAMTGAGGSADSGAGPERQWDVALSFAGAQRDYVEQVAAALKARGLRCFYDADE